MNGWRQHWQDGLLRGWEIGGQPELQEKEDDVMRFNVEWKSFHMDEPESDSYDEWYEDDGSLTPSRDLGSKNEKGRPSPSSSRSLFLSSLSFCRPRHYSLPSLPMARHGSAAAPLESRVHQAKEHAESRRHAVRPFSATHLHSNSRSTREVHFPKKLRGRNHDEQQTTFLETLLRYSTSCPTRSSLKSALRRDTVTHQRRTLILQTRDQTKQLGQMRRISRLTIFWVYSIRYNASATLHLA